MKLRANFFSVFGVLWLLVSGCKKEETTAASASTVPSSIHLNFVFSHNIDGAAVIPDTIKYLNKAGNKYSVNDLKYFICDIVLHKGADSVFINEAHYIDISIGSTYTYTPTQLIANGSYDYISFIFGLDASKNVNNYFVNAPESNMMWPVPMGGGYHYMQLDGKFDSATLVKNYAVHMGALNGVQRYIPIRLLQSSFTAKGTDLTVNLAMNINEWFENPNTYNFNTYLDTSMSSVAAQQILQQNGADVFTVNSIQ